jgi:hypothetical protein
LQEGQFIGVTGGHAPSLAQIIPYELTSGKVYLARQCQPLTRDSRYQTAFFASEVNNNASLRAAARAAF